MDKNWLIRTKNFQILGPVSKDKIINFIEQKKLSPEDEIGSGNGYWFFISEQDLLERHLYGDIPQGFNEVSEAQSVVSIKKDGQTASINISRQALEEVGRSVKEVSNPEILVPVDDDLAYPNMDAISVPDNEDLEYPNLDEISVPSGEDLEYPDMDSVGSSMIGAGEIEVPSFDEDPTLGISEASSNNTEVVLSEEDLAEGKLPESDDLEYPDISSIGKSVEEEIATFESENAFEEDTQEVNVVPIDRKTSMESRVTLSGTTESELKVKEKLKAQIKNHPRSARRKKAPPKVEREMQSKKLRRGRNDSYLFILLIVFVAFVIGIFFYYKRTFSSIPTINSIFIPSDVIAQELTDEVKKKVFLRI